ncbi:MAG TPA: lipid-binding SYLF domain-containing protein, partial [Bryobacteraceae bacterium]|nr:lipid-binding SYLF domain-containing protein [Bryobacteraceae bacterium]
AAGPVGRSTQAETDAALTAEILTWSRSRGLFAGVSLSGATLRQDDDWNQEMYGRVLTNREIVTGNTAPPKSAAALLAALNKYSSRK